MAFLVDFHCCCYVCYTGIVFVKLWGCVFAENNQLYDDVRYNFADTRRQGWKKRYDTIRILSVSVSVSQIILPVS